MSENKRALVAGSTGMVGKELVRALGAHAGYGEVVQLVRREVDAPPGVRSLRVDFDDLAHTALPAANVAYCCLGTTIKKARSQEAFIRVDRDMVLAFAAASKTAGVHTFVLVSSLGANPDSSVFYSRIKGETEQALRELGFAQLVLVRPSILAGDREESRPGEAVGLALMGVLSPLMLGPLRRYRPSHADVVARAMIQLAATPGEAVRVVNAEELPALAQDERAQTG